MTPAQKSRIVQQALHDAAMEDAKFRADGRPEKATQVDAILAMLKANPNAVEELAKNQRSES